MSLPRFPCPVFCIHLSVEACLSPSLPLAVFALRLVGCDNVCCSSLVMSITAGSRRFPAVNSQSIYVPFGLVNSKKKGQKRRKRKTPLDRYGLHQLLIQKAHGAAGGIRDQWRAFRLYRSRQSVTSRPICYPSSRLSAQHCPISTQVG